MITNINDLQFDNIAKEIDCIKKDLKCGSLKVEKYYLYMTFFENVNGRPGNIIKEIASKDGLKNIIKYLDKIREDINIKFLSFGLEYSDNNFNIGARDLLTIKKC